MVFHKITKRVAIFYGAWVLVCVFIAASGFGDSKAGHLYAVFTGIPFSILTLEITPNGSVLATLAAGAIGWFQWCSLTELSYRWDAWRESKRNAQT